MVEMGRLGGRWVYWGHVFCSYGQRICVGVGWMFLLGALNGAFWNFGGIEVTLAFSVVTKRLS